MEGPRRVTFADEMISGSDQYGLHGGAEAVVPQRQGPAAPRKEAGEKLRHIITRKLPILRQPRRRFVVGRVLTAAQVRVEVRALHHRRPVGPKPCPSVDHSKRPDQRFFDKHALDIEASASEHYGQLGSKYLGDRLEVVAESAC